MKKYKNATPVKLEDGYHVAKLNAITGTTTITPYYWPTLEGAMRHAEAVLTIDA